jgi:hypothetical protein
MIQRLDFCRIAASFNQTLKSDSAILSPFAQKYAQKSPTLLRRLAWRYVSRRE